MRLQNKGFRTPRRRLHPGVGTLERRLNGFRVGIQATASLSGNKTAAATGARSAVQAMPAGANEPTRRRSSAGASAGVLIAMVWA